MLLTQISYPRGIALENNPQLVQPRIVVGRKLAQITLAAFEADFGIECPFAPPSLSNGHHVSSYHLDSRESGQAAASYSRTLNLHRDNRCSASHSLWRNILVAMLGYWNWLSGEEGRAKRDRKLEARQNPNGAFVNPGAGPRQAWRVGEVQNITFDTIFQSYNIALWQQNRGGGGATLGPVLFRKFFKFFLIADAATCMLMSSFRNRTRTRATKDDQFYMDCPNIQVRPRRFGPISAVDIQRLGRVDTRETSTIGFISILSYPTRKEGRHDDYETVNLNNSCEHGHRNRRHVADQ